MHFTIFATEIDLNTLHNSEVRCNQPFFKQRLLNLFFKVGSLPRKPTQKIKSTGF
jgi:hypothetical protein